MLREKTTHAIALLYEANGTINLSRVASFRNCCETERTRLQSLLTSAGLIDYSGKLLRPLSSISLYELLLLIDEGIYPSHIRKDLIGDLPVHHHIPPCKMGLYQDMICQMLMQIKISEL